MTTYSTIRPYRQGGKLLNHHGRVRAHRKDWGLYTPAEITAMVDNDDYIPVATADELDGLRNAVVQTMGAGTEWEAEYLTGLDKKYVQVRNIDLSEFAEWQQLGGITTNRIRLTFDGNELSIINLQSTNYGLFGGSAGSELSNMNVSGTVNATNTSATILLRSVTGNSTKQTKISNCNTYGSVLSTDSYAAGILGATNYNDVIIENCTNYASVTGTSLTGGICGFDQGDSLTINNCVNNGNISGTTSVGGLCGNLNTNSNIVNSYSIGAVVGDSSIGGLVGSGSGVVINSYYDTETSGQNDTGKGEPRTTEQMQQGTADSFILPAGGEDTGEDPDNAMYTTWDDDIWLFTPNTKYAKLK